MEHETISVHTQVISQTELFYTQQTYVAVFVCLYIFYKSKGQLILKSRDISFHLRSISCGVVMLFALYFAAVCTFWNTVHESVRRQKE